MKNIFKSIVVLSCLITTSSNLLSQWIQTNGPYGGSDVWSFAVNGKYIFAGTAKGIYRSTDYGASWTPVNPDLRIYNFAVIDTILFATNYDSGLFVTNYNSVIRSDDNGTNWIEVDSGLPNSGIYALAVNDTSLFVGTDRGIFRSCDYGTTWVPVNNGLANTSVSELAVSSGYLFAGTYGRHGVFRSSNNGTTWTATGLTNVSVSVLAVCGTHLFVQTSAPVSSVFRSSDNGATWIPVDSSLTNHYVNAFAFSGTGIFASTWTSGVFRSNDNGATWAPVNSGLTRNDVVALAATDIYIFAGTHGGGVFRFNDNGASWIAANTGFAHTDVYNLFGNDMILFAGTNGGKFSSVDKGVTWVPIDSSLMNHYVNAFVDNGMFFFLGSWSGGVFCSSDNGITWTSANTGLTDTCVTALAVIGTNLFAGTDGGVFLSTDNGTSWTAVSNGLTDTHVEALAVSGSNLFALSYIESSFGKYGFFCSSDTGRSWIELNSPLNVEDWNHYVRDFVIIDTSFFVATAGGNSSGKIGILRSTDNGASWVPVNTGLPSLDVWALAARDTHLFAGTDDGVFLSTDNGTSWAPVNEGLTNISVSAFVIGDNNLYAGTFGSGVWRRPLSELITTMSAERGSIGKPTQFNLKQNYPNPFNPATTIEFALPKPAFVTLKIYNLLGEEVATLVAEKREAGIYILNWDAKGLASGVYLYRLEAGEFVQTKKLILMR